MEGNDKSGNPSLSNDAAIAAIESSAPNFVIENGMTNIFVRNFTDRAVQRVSVGLDGKPDSPSTNPSVSGNGKYVAIESLASNLVAGDENEHWDVFVHNSGPADFPYSLIFLLLSD